MVDIENCPICNHQESTLFLKSKNFRITFEDFHVQECKNCGFKFTSPLPTEHEIGKYYNTENYTDSLVNLFTMLDVVPDQAMQVASHLSASNVPPTQVIIDMLNTSGPLTPEPVEPTPKLISYSLPPNCN